MTNVNKIPCASLLNEELKWKETVEALDAAIQIYITRGYLHIRNNVVIPSGGPQCTTDYDVSAESDEADWEAMASHILMVTIDMKSDFFQKETDSNGDPAPQLTISNDQSFYLRFDGTYRMWYTLEEPDEIIKSEIQSDPFNENKVANFNISRTSFDSFL